MLNSKSTLILLLLLSLTGFSCSEESETDLTPQLEGETAQDQFYANLFSLCGETFTGSSTFPEDDDHPLVNTELNITISTCTSEEIEIDLLRDGDTWHATWIISKRDDGLHLHHDHIGDKEYPEGEEPLTGYGGYANDQGSSTRQYFPADEHTAEILPEASTNVWMISIDPDTETLVYNLERNDEPRFRAELQMN